MATEGMRQMEKGLPFLEADHHTQVWKSQKQAGNWFYYDNSYGSPEA